MRNQFPAWLDVDDFCTVNRRRLLRGLGAAALLTATGGLFRRYEDGHVTAYQQIAAERFDFVFHYGDYIYEYRVVRPGERPLAVVRDMPDAPDEIYTRDDYRHRYAIYESDPDLQAAHTSAPFIMSYDDHEVDNNWAGDISEEDTPPELFRLRRAAAFQAWYEHMPVRRTLMPRGPDILAYRRFAVGDLVSMNVLDTRLFRSDQPCGDGVKADCHEALQAGLAQNPHMKFFNNQRGYVRHMVTPDRWQADFQVLDKVSVRDSHVSTRKSFVVDHGKNGLAEA